jgi:hypothetical protein
MMKLQNWIRSTGPNSSNAAAGAAPAHARTASSSSQPSGPLTPRCAGTPRTASLPPRLALLPKTAQSVPSPPLRSLSGEISAASSSTNAAFRMGRLLGATIDPAVATVLLDEVGEEHLPLKFDGFGRIDEFAFEEGQYLPDELMARLENATIKPLTHTNSLAPRDAPRAERDLLVRAMNLLQMAEAGAGTDLQKEARALFMSHSFSRESVAAFLKRGAEQLSQDVLLQDQFQKLHAESLKPVTMTQRADNVYGRTFESLLVEDLVLDPPPGVLAAAGELAEGIMETLELMHSGERDPLMRELVNVLKDDVRPWFAKSPSMQAFARAPSSRTFAACLADTSDGLEAIKVVHLAQRFVLAINNASERDEIERPRWYDLSLNYYSDFLSTQKPQTKFELEVPAGKPGNWLHYQRNASSLDMPVCGENRNWTHYRMPDPAELSMFEKDALLRGQPVVNGMSGQTCMVSIFGQHLARQNPALSLPDLHLAALMCLVFDGGHSTEEVVATVDALKAFHSPGSVEPGWSSGFRGGYEAIADMAGDEATRQTLRERMDSALDRTLRYCAEHIA